MGAIYHCIMPTDKSFVNYSTECPEYLYAIHLFFSILLLKAPQGVYNGISDSRPVQRNLTVMCD